VERGGKGECYGEKKAYATFINDEINGEKKDSRVKYKSLKKQLRKSLL